MEWGVLVIIRKIEFGVRLMMEPLMKKKKKKKSLSQAPGRCGHGSEFFISFLFVLSFAWELVEVWVSRLIE